MSRSRFDAVARRFAERRNPRRVAETEAAPSFMFVQRFAAGGFSPKDGDAGEYTLTLEAGLGQTVYFSNRPERIVGAAELPGDQHLRRVRPRPRWRRHVFRRFRHGPHVDSGADR